MSRPASQEQREFYRYFCAIPTRWKDLDLNSHVNNVVFYSYFDTLIQDYLVKAGGLDFINGAVVGFAVETHCQFLKPITFPMVLDAGLRVSKLGNTSCRYEIGLFVQDDPEPCAVGYFVHVFVDRDNANKPTPIVGQMRDALSNLLVE